MYVALHGRHDDGAVVRALVGLFFFFFDEGQQIGHGLFHHARGFHHLRQEHLAGTEQIAHHVHAVHERAFDHIQRPGGLLAGFFGVFGDVAVDALDQGVFEALVDLELTPGEVFLGILLLALAFVFLGQVEQPFGGIVALVEDDILAGLAQLFRNVVIDFQLPGVDDGHVQPGRNRVVEKHRVHGLAHGFVATKRKRYVRQPAGDMTARTGFTHAPGGVDKVHGVVVVLFDTGGDGEDIEVEDDVFGREVELFDQQLVGALGDLDLAILGIGLALFVEGHDHHGGAVVQTGLGLFQELVFAFLERDGVDHPLALDTLQPGLDDFPLRGVDHHRHLGDIRLAGDQVQELAHGLDRVEHALVHVDIDDLGPVLDLLTGHRQRGVVILFLDQPFETRTAGNVRALADVDEVDC